MKKILPLSFIFASILMVSCDDFLTAIPNDKIVDVGFWNTESDVSKFVTNIYAASLKKDYQGCPFWDEALSDNSYLVWSWWGGQMQLANGTMDAYGQVPTDTWNTCFQNVRRCYQLLENIDKVNASKDFKDISIAETRFLLAYNYYRMYALMGNLPIVTKVLTIEESKQLIISPKKTVAQFIIDELDKAIPLLEGKSRGKGRITWGACQALKSRMLLYEQRWDEALETSNLLIGKYQLQKEGETPYADLFAGVAEDSPEIILSIPCDYTSGSITVSHYGNQCFLLKGMSGGDAFRGMMPTGSLVDSYPMSDGRLIHETGSAYDPHNPYVDRDPRFYQTIIYPTSNIKVYDAETNSIKEVLYDPEDPNTIPLQQYDASEPSATGYVWNKYVDWNLHAMNDIRDCGNDIIVLRYGEILLNKAEALLESKGLEAKDEIIHLIDQLRDRCGAGLVHRENYCDIEKLRLLVRNERRIELAGEGTRYYDLLRWRIAECDNFTTGYGLHGDVYGAYMRLDGKGSQDKVVMVDGVPRRYVETRVFNPDKHYLNPIPQSEIDLNPNLVQNPGW